MRTSLLLFLLFFASCKKAEVKTVSFDCYPAVPDSVRVKMLQSAVKTAQLFNLPVIYNGVDSIEIRIRYWNAFGPGTVLYLLRADSMGWRGFHYDAYTLFQKKEDGTEIRYADKYAVGDSVFMVKEFTPVCGWKKFTDTLYSFKLTQLPTQQLIKNFIPIRMMDGDGYTIEIATPNSYRHLIYATPELYEYEECKAISLFIAFLRRQMGKNYNWPANLPPTKNKPR